MVLAKPAGTNPRALADLLAAELGALDEVTEAGVAGPGFINLRVADDSWRAELALIRDEAGDYGRSAMGQGRRVNVEYVSANPTGPMPVDRKSGGEGTRVSVRVELGGRRIIQKKKRQRHEKQ